MSHVRQQIRDAVVNLLGAQPQNWRAVVATRIEPMRQIMPYVMVWTPDEPVEISDVGVPGVLQRQTSLITRAHIAISDAEAVEEKFDAVAAEIEQKLTTLALQAALAKQPMLSLVDSVTEIVVNDQMEVRYGAVQLTWRVTSFTVEGQPETLL